MILREQNISPECHKGELLIPATFFDGQLKFENNGSSEIFFGEKPRGHSVCGPDNFVLYGFGSDPKQRPFFIKTLFPDKNNPEIPDEDIRDNENLYELWELFYVYGKRAVEPDGTVKRKHVLYSCLRECRCGTLFCVCEDCSKHFVLTPQTIRFYKDRDLKPPVIRCPECIQAKKIKYNNR